MDGQETQTEPIRLLKVLALFAAGGTEGQVLNLVRGLDRSRFDLQFACLRKWGHFLEEIERRDIPISEYRIKSLYKPRTFLQQLRFALYMRSRRIQIMHSYNFYANVFAIPAARLAGVPLVLASVRDRGVYLTRAQKEVQKRVCGMADRILVNADSIRDWLVEEGYRPDKITTIRNGIDMTSYNQARTSTVLRRDWNIPPNAPLVVMLSRLNPQKGVEDFIKAAALINRRHPEARFLIVGEKMQYKGGVFGRDVSYHKELEQLAAELGIADKVIFTGHREDVPEFLTAATVSVLPSLSEGLSNTLLESMAAGAPVVATNVGGNPELVHDGVTGILVPPRAPRAIADAVNCILDDPALARRFRLAARKRADDCFSMKRMVRDTQDLYVSQLRQKVRAGRRKPSVYNGNR